MVFFTADNNGGAVTLRILEDEDADKDGFLCEAIADDGDNSIDGLGSTNTIQSEQIDALY